MNLYNVSHSHPDKLLIDHVRGILSYVDESYLSEICTLFHDTGKTNPYFQDKLFKIKTDKYNNHSALSALILLTYLNEKFKEDFILSATNIVVGHHGYLRNIGEIFNEEEYEKLFSFLKNNDISNNINLYLSTYKEYSNHSVNNLFNKLDYYKEFYHVLGNYGDINSKDFNLWKKDSLRNYFNTLYTYANLVYGDRKDASKNTQQKRTHTNKQKLFFALQNNLDYTFNSFKPSEINEVRTAIRLNAENNLRTQLNDNNNNRVFSLTSPTGSGKTLMMLKLATIIQEKFNYEYDIIYALPFLSIIDQTSAIIDKLYIENLKYTSLAETSKQLQLAIENDDDKNLTEILFNENSFDETFIVTTFVQLFETFLSNKTSKVLKLRNFSKRIFLIDEIQSLPPYLYKFFNGILEYFCKTYDSYAIVSSATMPKFDLEDIQKNNNNVKNIFKNYHIPTEIVDKKFFNNKIFNRYTINYIGEHEENSLYQKINAEEVSTLCIVNTINTSSNLYNKFVNNTNFEKVYLLNTHICPKHRIEKIEEIKYDLEHDKKILVISTQLIEAGVDVDFPILYRDAAPAASIVQSAGRCNRNSKIESGKVNIFLFKELRDGKYKYVCDYIYKGISKYYEKFNTGFNRSEIEYRNYLDKYFDNVSEYSKIGENGKNDLLDFIYNGKFIELGKFSLIDNNVEDETIYIGDDNLWDEYRKLYEEYIIEYKMPTKIKLESKRKEITQYCVSINTNQVNKYNIDIVENICGIEKISNVSNIYSKDYGIFSL